MQVFNNFGDLYNAGISTTYPCVVPTALSIENAGLWSTIKRAARGVGKFIPTSLDSKKFKNVAGKDEWVKEWATYIAQNLKSMPKYEADIKNNGAQASDRTYKVVQNIINYYFDQLQDKASPIARVAFSTTHN